MKQYSIGELEHISGIKAHTIRVWENRYALLKPERSEGNTRYYSENDLKKLMMVALLNKNGLRISKIANMDLDQLQDMADQPGDSNVFFPQLIDSLLLYSIQFDENKLIELMNSLIDQYGIEVSFRKVVFPFLRKVGVLWLSGKITPGHEHFFSNLCRQKLFAEIDKMPPSTPEKPHYVLFQPSWDLHELGILFYFLLLRKNHFPSTYLGQAVPATDAISAINTTQAAYAISSFIAPTSPSEIESFLQAILEGTQHTKLLLTGPHLNFQVERLSERIIVFRSIEELKKIVESN